MESHRSCPVLFSLAESWRPTSAPERARLHSGRSEKGWNAVGHPFGCPARCYFLPDLAGFLGACGLRTGFFFAGTHPSDGTLPDEPVRGECSRRAASYRCATTLDRGNYATGWRMIVFSFAGSILRGSPR